jgi:hypothetical protein
VSTRLRHIKSGAVVSVSAETAAQLGGEWEPVEKPVKKAAPSKKAAAKSSKK